MLTNLTAARSLCNAIASSFYPDEATVAIVLLNLGLDPDTEAAPKDPAVFRAALALVNGYVEGSRSEGGVSVSVLSEDAIRASIKHWCRQYDLDPEEEMADYIRVIDDGSKLW